MGSHKLIRFTALGMGVNLGGALLSGCTGNIGGTGPGGEGGGTGGYFKMGQVLTLPATSPTKVLVSLATSMGVEVASLGSGAFRDTQPLSGLTP